MTMKFKIIPSALMLLLILSCSNTDDDNSGSSAVFGTIQLSGEDTSSVGTSLVVGNLDADASGITGTPSSVVLLDQHTTIENGELNPTDIANAFVIVVAQFGEEDNAAVEKTISMNIVKNGEEFRYVCSTPPIASANDTDCGAGFSVDKMAKRIVFDNTTVVNVDSETILTMNGTIDYN